MGETTFRIPEAAWTRNASDPLDQVKGPSKMTLGNVFKMLPLIIRMFGYVNKRKAGGFDPINMVPPEQTGPYQGVPLGGIGAGSIGRGWRGDFRRWQLRPGYIYNAPVMADQFSLFIKREGEAPTAQVLFPNYRTEGPLRAWAWEMTSRCASYKALFPRAWHIYEEPVPGVRLTCRQLSPVIANNYRESSLPVSEFRWKIENLSNKVTTVGLMFTFQNGMGQPNDSAGEHSNHLFQVDGITGIKLRHAYRQNEASETKRPSERATYGDPLTFAMAAQGGEISYRSRFVTSGDGSDIWQDFRLDGRLDNVQDERPSNPGETIGAGMAIRVRLGPGETREAAFSLAWDMPLVRPGCGTPYHRHYTRFYSPEGDAGPRMAVDALQQADRWEAAVMEWQAPLVDNPALPMWYRTALINELYYLVDGGTIWAHPVLSSAPDAEMGHFGYLEGHEYRMYNTYDVHFYASFALAMLWPRLELAIQRDIADATLAEYPDTMQELYTGKRGRRKLRGAVPHDVGWPDEDPWRKVNGYFLHDVNNWKDLNPKFVLQVYRDYVATNDYDFLMDMLPAVEEAIARVKRFDRDGDGLIENDGFPDQTYDVWSVKGPSAYTGGLWLACLSAGACLAEAAGRADLASAYRSMLGRGRLAYESKLWNGRYFNYDTSTSKQHDSIMADQMAGQWYARACRLDPIVDPIHARSALSTVYDWNVQRFNNGRMGAVNGMRPDGSVDTTSMQSQEVWSGTSYAVAAAMIQEGLVEAGFKTAEGVYKMTYENTGYWFQTPEAWDAQGNYRSICYMRPLAIWAMQWALQRKEI